MFRSRFKQLARLLPPPKPSVSVLRFKGHIAAPASGGQRAINLENFTPALERAFESPGSQAVVMIINSGGGSAVQSSLIYKRIAALKAQHNKSVVAFIEDICASGGYFLACAADEIYVDEGSVVGSIGVVAASMGLTQLAEKIGLERRVYTSGDCKVQLDPFLPEKQRDVNQLKVVLHGVHEHFINVVKDSRGAKLKPELAATKAQEIDPKVKVDTYTGLYDGSYYIGNDAVDIGLVDGVGSFNEVIRKRYGEDIKLKEFKSKGQSPLARFGMSIGTSFADGLHGILERESTMPTFK